MALESDNVTYLCQRCGNCCRWPGDVILKEEEVKPIADHLGIDEMRFIQDYTRLSANRKHLSIIDKADGSCFFLEGVNTCRIQPVKPGQCSGFPNKWRFDGWREVCEAIPVSA